MKQIPILFSTQMVRAILEGRKTQTRRILKAQPSEDAIMGVGEFNRALTKKNGDMYPGPDSYGAISEDGEFCLQCPYGQPGEVLWVRESFNVGGYFDGGYAYKASPDSWHDSAETAKDLKWKPSIHMPKAAARIWLEITNMRVERLNGISERDAINEGISNYKDVTGRRFKNYMANSVGYGDPDHDYPTVGLPVTSFCTLWQSINGPESWYENPWVWVIEFKRIEKPTI